MRSVLCSFVAVLSLINVVSVSSWFGDSGGDGGHSDGDNAGNDENVGTVIGIDLGTTYSCVGVFRNGRVEIIANDQGNRITPSYVAFTPEERLVGDSARNQMISNPENTIYDVKRLIGRTWDDQNVQKDIKFYPFKVVNMANKPHVQAQVKGQTKTFTPEEISAMVLGKMRDIAQDYLGKRVTHAVVTVPAYFNNGQRQATKDAGTIAGLKVMKIINEPTAAAIAYGLYKREGVKTILVFDLGGGTFDVSLLTINNGNFKVRATNGDTHLGGEDFDMRVIEHFIELHKRKTGRDIHKSNRAVQKLRREVEKAKRVLSSQLQVRVEVDSIFDNQDFSEMLTRAKFEELNLDLFRSTVQPLKQVLEDAGVGKEEVNDIVLVGGSTRIPKIQQLVKDFFSGKDPSRDINPDEAVAYGAAVQAGMLSGEEETGELVLWDVNPLSLGAERFGGIMDTFIARNTVIPTKVSKTVTTILDNQEAADINIYEGERSMARQNHFLGHFVLTGIPPLPRGVPQLEVTFNIDENGLLHVTAEEKSTGNKNGIVIDTDRNALSQQEIERMIQDAEKFAEQDKKAKQRVDAKNKLELYLYTLKSQVSDNDRLGGKLSERDKRKVSESVEDAVLWMEAHRDADTEELKQKQKEVESVVNPIVKHLYGWRDEF